MGVDSLYNGLSMPNYLIIIILAAILVWQAALTFIFLRIFKNFKDLTKDVNGENLEEILKKILHKQSLSIQDIANVGAKLSILEKKNLEHIQRFGVIRFNPFNETGGDNSFTLCLLNGNLDGVVLTGLHTRDKTRLYAKEIKKGKSEYDLSKEEEKAINIALKS